LQRDLLSPTDELFRVEKFKPMGTGDGWPEGEVRLATGDFSNLVLHRLHRTHDDVEDERRYGAHQFLLDPKQQPDWEAASSQRGIPLGSTTPTVKAIEARDAIANGADEIDMVMNVGALKSGNDALALEDIRAVREATRGRVLKVILETGLLTADEKKRACKLSKQAGADFVKTSTGFGAGGATVEDIRLMRETVGPTMGVKASGGVRDKATAEAMIAAGATRIGASASVAIVMGEKPAGGGKY